jgi:hypothetical protein
MDIDVDGMEIGAARCRAVEIAREQRLRYLFFLDWDVIAPPDTMARLLYLLENHPEHDVAAGIYTLKSNPPWPLIWREWGTGVSFDWTVGEILDKDVVAIPMGCTLLRLSLFDRLEQTEEKPWFKTMDEVVAVGGVPQKGMVTEDIWFCQRFVKEMQGKIVVDAGLLCEHICHSTGRRYHLDTESMPWKRLREKEKSATKQQSCT